jgi:hypothetical protein
VSPRVARQLRVDHGCDSTDSVPSGNIESDDWRDKPGGLHPQHARVLRRNIPLRKFLRSSTSGNVRQRDQRNLGHAV